MITHLRNLMTQQHRSSKTYERYFSLNATTLQWLMTSATPTIHFAMTMSTLMRQCLKIWEWVRHMFTWLDQLIFTKINPLKHQNKLIHIVWQLTWKNTIFFPFFQKGPKQLEKTHGRDLNVCDDNIQDQGRLWNLVQAKILEGVVAMTKVTHLHPLAN